MFDFDDADDMSREELVALISDFMTNNMSVEQVYRSHLCETLVSRIAYEFGTEGLCDMMIKIDSKAGWISDILLDAPELENAMFNKYGVFDVDLIHKARNSQSLIELNRKIFRLRKKYTKLIVDEIWEAGASTKPEA